MVIDPCRSRSTRTFIRDRPRQSESFYILRLIPVDESVSSRRIVPDSARQVASFQVGLDRSDTHIPGDIFVKDVEAKWDISEQVVSQSRLDGKNTWRDTFVSRVTAEILQKLRRSANRFQKLKLTMRDNV